MVDGERWRRALRKEADFSEWTPCDACTMTLQGPDGYRRSFTLDFNGNDNDPVTPGRVAEIIREKKKTWPDVG